jgi:sulfite reductase alpha subunit-like flavoprotein
MKCSLTRWHYESPVCIRAGEAITLRAALARYTDLLSPISKSSLQAFSAFADGEEKLRLTHLLSPEGAADYKEWHQQSRCLLEVLEEFPNTKPHLGEAFPFTLPPPT